MTPISMRADRFAPALDRPGHGVEPDRDAPAARRA